MINPLDQPRSSFVSARNRRFLVTQPYFLSSRGYTTAPRVFLHPFRWQSRGQRHFIATDHEVRVLDALTQRPRVKRLPSAPFNGILVPSFRDFLTDVPRDSFFRDKINQIIPSETCSNFVHSRPLISYFMNF